MNHDAASPIGRSNGSGSLSARHTSVLADPGQLAALRQNNLLDTPAEEAFDRLVRQAAHLLEVPIALVSLLDQDRQVLKASVGLPKPWASARPTPLPSLCCQQLLLTRQSLVIPDTRRHPRTRDDEFLLAHGLAAYLSVPLIVDGQVLGSLCVADRQPRHWTAEQVATLTELVGPLLTQLQQRADLAARGELQRRLAEVEARQQALLERLPGVVYTLGPEPPHQVLSISPQIEVLLGEPAVDWIGESDIWKRLVHPDDVEWVTAEYERAKQTGEPFSVEYRMRTRDGQVRWVRDEAVLVHGGDGRPLCWQGILSDLTATRLTAERLAEAVDREQQAAQQLAAALEREQGTARQLAAALEREQGTARQLAAALDREQATAEQLRAVDEMKPRLARLAEALDREQDTAQQLAAALDRERAAAEQLRAVDEMKTTFLEAVSHDLRSPLTTVLGIALTLERSGGAGGLPAEEVADLLGRLSANARKLDRLLGDLLDLDRLARGSLAPRRQVVDLGGLVRRVVEDADVQQEHAVVVDAPTLRIAVDAPKVERIVENLVVNAAKHTQAGTAIWVRVQSQRDGVLLVVEDEGPGVPAQQREQVFQPFRKGRNVADHAPGSGIGLAVVAQFASLHGGRAWVQDRPGGGASFRVFLPDPQRLDASST
jgi:PAS domain S-box-containing protein